MEEIDDTDVKTKQIGSIQLTRRELLIGSTLGVLTGLGLAACSSQDDKRPTPTEVLPQTYQIPNTKLESGITEITLDRELLLQLSENERIAVIDGATAFISTYGCPIDHVAIKYIDLASETHREGNYIIQISEVAEPGIVYLDPNLARSEQNSLGKIFDDTIHGLGHACQPPMVLLDESYTLADGNQVIGYEGLSPIVNIQTETGDYQGFRLIEEGAIDTIVARIPRDEAKYGNYSITHPDYREYRMLTLMLLAEFYHEDYDALANHLQNHELETLVKIIFQKDEFDPKDLERLMTAYQLINQGQLTSVDAFTGLVEYIHAQSVEN